MGASDQLNEHPDRRTGERMEILGDLQGAVMVYQSMAIRELSHDGAQIETSFPLHIDSLHDIRLELNDASVVLRGRIVHCSIADMDRGVVNYRCGVEFIEPGEGARRVVERFIEAVKTGRLAR